MHQCVFFNSSNHPDESIKKFLLSYDIDININKSIFQNKSSDNAEHLKFSTFFKNLLEEKPHLLNRIQDVYQEDYNLINRVKFYGQR
mgnify:CR=1 FL=1